MGQRQILGLSAETLAREGQGKVAEVILGVILWDTLSIVRARFELGL